MTVVEKMREKGWVWGVSQIHKRHRSTGYNVSFRARSSFTVAAIVDDESLAEAICHAVCLALKLVEE
jgi:hypothetical protein